MTNEKTEDEWSNAQADFRRVFEESGNPMWVRQGLEDGSFIDVEVASLAVTFREQPASLESILDVTYRRKTEARASYLDLLLATVTDAVVTSDEKIVLTGWNAAAESTFGRRADEVLGQPDELVFRTDFVDVCFAQLMPGSPHVQSRTSTMPLGQVHRPPTSPRDDIAVAVMVGSWLALLSKLHGSSCLTHVGRESSARATSDVLPRSPCRRALSLWR